MSTSSSYAIRPVASNFVSNMQRCTRCKNATRKSRLTDDICLSCWEKKFGCGACRQVRTVVGSVVLNGDVHRRICAGCYKRLTQAPMFVITQEFIPDEGEFVPAGEWPRAESSDVGNDKRSSIRTIDAGRFRFLERICPAIHTLEFAVRRQAHPRKAFLIRAVSGKKFALLESPETQRRLYILPVVDGWEETAKLSAYELRQLGVCGMNHTASFERRVINFLATH